MTRLNNDGEDFFGGRIPGYADHLCPRHHDITHLHVGDLKGAFDHRQGFAVNDIALLRLTGDFQELRPVERFASENMRDALQPGAGRRSGLLAVALGFVRVVVFVHRGEYHLLLRSIRFVIRVRESQPRQYHPLAGFHAGRLIRLLMIVT